MGRPKTGDPSLWSPLWDVVFPPNYFAIVPLLRCETMATLTFEADIIVTR
jgi:hypothetical protein